MLTITEAHAVNVLLGALIDSSRYPDIDPTKLEQAAELLADHASKTLMAGLSVRDVRAGITRYGYRRARAKFAGKFDAIVDERIRQDAKWGEQNHPDGTGGYIRRVEADEARKACSEAADDRAVTWRHILAEEVAEAFAEEDSGRLVEELVQVAAVAVAWIEAIGRRRAARACRVCGCTEDAACVDADGPCGWTDLDLCTGCAKDPFHPAPTFGGPLRHGPR